MIPAVSVFSAVVYYSNTAVIDVHVCTTYDACTFFTMHHKHLLSTYFTIWTISKHTFSQLCLL